MTELRASMTTIGFDHPGGPEVLQAVQLPLPAAAGQVLMRVAFAGVNRPDVIQRQGHYPPPPDASPIPGLEMSGEVVAVDASIDRTMVANTT